jgi:DNA-binding SARP family transcriptional activator
MPRDRSRVRSDSPARLEVRLLGAVEVILDGRRLGAFNALRLQRILALIAVRSDPQHRSRLAFELWPDSNDRPARPRTATARWRASTSPERATHRIRRP